MKSWQPAQTHFSRLKESFKNGSFSVMVNGGAPVVSGDDMLPEGLIGWLAKLSLLYGVPFNYLVPDNRMLPSESLRLFHVDLNWIMNLVDGACSIGRVTDNDVLHDRAMLSGLYDALKKEIPKVRGQMKGEPDQDLPACGDVFNGILVRSSIVEGWPGLEVKAFKNKDEVTPLRILRMDRLAADVLLCIFDGEFKRIELREPAETLHFGADIVDGKYIKIPRGLGVGKVPLGKTVIGAKVAIAFRDDEMRVVDIKKTVEKFKTVLGAEIGLNFSSAEFAVQMIESAQMGVFDDEKA